MISNNDTVSVVVSTYNGERYIEEQIYSIVNQTMTPDEIIICDDCSADDTLVVVENTIKKYGNRNIKFIVEKNEVNSGVIKNFEKGISIAGGDYIMLSDQDDYWIENKIEVTYGEFKKLEGFAEKRPLLVYTDLYIVDEKLKIVNKSMQRAQNILPSGKDGKYLLIQNNITGCTVMINKMLKEIALPFPKHIVMHDWWLGLVAYLKGEIAYLDRSTILYRQHNNNVVGAQKYIRNIIKRVLDINYNIKSIDNVSNQLRDALLFKNGELFKNRKTEKNIAESVINKNVVDLVVLRCKKLDCIKSVGFYVMLFISKYMMPKEK